MAKKILSLIENANKLIYFSLSLNFQYINRKSYEFINNCKSLEYLNLRDIKFASGLTLNLPNLKKLDLVFCDNVILSKEIIDKLNSLTIINSSIGDDKQLNFPELKKIYLSARNINKLLLQLESELLEVISIDIYSSYELKMILEKINYFKCLKKLTIK